LSSDYSAASWAPGQATRLPAIRAHEQRDDEVPEASTVNDAAVAA